MKTTIHKAVVAALSSAATLAGVLFGVDLTREYGIGEAEIVSFGTLVTTLLVYFVPNKPKQEAKSDVEQPPQ